MKNSISAPEECNTDTSSNSGLAPSTSRRKRISILLLGLAITVVALEVVLRNTGVAPAISPLVKLRIDGRDYWAPNYAFYVSAGVDVDLSGQWDTDMFFAQDPKPPNTYRVVVFGESAAKGEPPDGAFGFWRVLQKMLEARYPDARIEVLPLAYMATDSYVMYFAARASCRLQPDIFVVYMGNNEATGRYGVGNVFARMAGDNPAYYVYGGGYSIARWCGALWPRWQV